MQQWITNRIIQSAVSQRKKRIWGMLSPAPVCLKAKPQSSSCKSIFSHMYMLPDYFWECVCVHLQGGSGQTIIFYRQYNDKVKLIPTVNAIKGNRNKKPTSHVNVYKRHSCPFMSLMEESLSLLGWTRWVYCMWMLTLGEESERC